MLLRIGRESQVVSAGRIFIRTEHPVLVALGGKLILAVLAVGNGFVLIFLPLYHYAFERQRPKVGVVGILRHGDTFCSIPAHTGECADDAHRLDDDGLLDGGPYLCAFSGIGIVKQRHLCQCQFLVGTDDKFALGEGVARNLYHSHAVLHDFRQHGLARGHLDGGTATLCLDQEGLTFCVFSCSGEGQQVSEGHDGLFIGNKRELVVFSISRERQVVRSSFSNFANLVARSGQLIVAPFVVSNSLILIRTSL